jgi:hypothetical protein
MCKLIKIETTSDNFKGCEDGGGLMSLFKSAKSGRLTLLSSINDCFIGYGFLTYTEFDALNPY